MDDKDWTRMRELLQEIHPGRTAEKARYTWNSTEAARIAAFIGTHAAHLGPETRMEVRCTETGIGTAFNLACVCGATANPTDYEVW
jgi:hypothetical protein